MIENLLAEVNISPEELINQSVLKSRQAFEEISKFYHRIETQLNASSFVKKKPRESYAYDHIITHSKNVAFYSIAIAKAAKLSSRELCEIAVAAFLHDLEKIYWPMDLLYKKTKMEFTENDWKRIIEHPVATVVFIERLTKHQISTGVLKIIEQHHEDFNGEGYPKNISGEDICLGARIMRITDSYDSMVSPRPYKTQSHSRGAALNEFKNTAGITYDPKLVKLFEEVVVHLPVPHGIRLVL